MTDAKPHFSLLRWGGGKYYHVSKITRYIDPRVNSCEVFGGSIVITLNLPVVKKSKSEVVNDINSDIFNFWTVIRDKPGDFEERIKFVFNGEQWHDELMEEGTDVSRAVAFYLRNRNSFSGFGDTGKIKYTFANNPFLRQVDWWAERLRNVRIYNLDFRDIIERVNNLNQEWILYCDPPYYKAGGKGVGMYVEAKADGNNDVGFTPKDHRDLHELLAGSDKHWFLSYDDNPTVRDLYKDYHFKTIRKTYCGSANKEKKRRGKEVLISNRSFRVFGRSTGLSGFRS